MRVAEEFGKKVRETAERMGVKRIWNGDETAVFFDMIPTKTLETQGAKAVWIRCSAAQKKETRFCPSFSSI